MSCMWIPRRFSLVFALALLGAPAYAAPLAVLAPASATAGLQPLAAQYTASPGLGGTRGAGSRAAVRGALRAGPADVVMLPTSDLSELPTVSGMVPIGRMMVGVAGKAGTNVPDISTPEKFRAVLLAARGVAYADPSAGTSAGKAIDIMLQAPEFKAVKRVPVQGLAVSALANGSATIALQMLPELAADKDVAVAGPVPQSYGAMVDFSAGIAAVTNNATGAEAFISYLNDPKNAAVWRKAGLDPL